MKNNCIWIAKRYFLTAASKPNKRKALYFALLLLISTTILTVAYYTNDPQVRVHPDTSTYIIVMARFLAHPNLLVDPTRLPGYPLFITLISILKGYNCLTTVSNLTSKSAISHYLQLKGYNCLTPVSDAQAILFILMTLEIYLITLLLFQQCWLAFLVGLLVGTNLILLSYIKPIMSEGLATFLLTTFALTVVWFIRSVRVWKLWLVTLSLLLLIFTRPEWVYLPVLLLPCLLLISIQRKGLQKLIQYSIHTILSLMLIYLCVVAYIEINGIQNHYQIFTTVVNDDLIGKVVEYKMENEYPPKYKPIVRKLNQCIIRIDKDPFHFLACVPTLRAFYARQAGELAKSIILSHPGEFLFKTLPLFFSSLTDDYHRPTPHGPFYTPLSWLESFHQVLYQFNAFFPACVVICLFLLCWKPTRFRPAILAMGAIVLLLVYGIIVTTLVGYRPDDYARFHVVFDPLLILAIWGGFFKGLNYLFTTNRLYTDDQPSRSADC